MALTIGSRLGPYEITGQLGHGGMGEVYRARDTKLDRDVAVKVLPAAFATSPERLARFEREAKTLASLNHPHIGAIHGLEDSAGTKALILELVEGLTLAEWLAQGARLKAQGSTTESVAQGARTGPGLPVDEALAIAKQIAAALEAAHESGIVHRDLKPANIKLRLDGTVKVLDFGLAKALDPGSGTRGSGLGDLSQSPTITTPAMTQAGMILGTAAYMSPEQARGKAVDKRADIWAFACVLYEMLTGRRAFGGEDVTETIADVVRGEVDWDELPKGLSPTLVLFLKRCLQKDPKQRVHDIADLRLALDGAFDAAAPSQAGHEVSPASSLRRWVLPVALTAVVTAALVGVTIWAFTRPHPASPAQFELTTPPDAPPGLPILSDVAVSPDGTKIVYASISGLFLRRTDQLEATALRGAEAPAGNPFFSPDGQQVGFTSRGDLKQVSALGGPATTIATMSVNGIAGASWGRDGTIVFGHPNGGLWQVSSVGGEPKALTTIDRSFAGVGSHRWPDVLPNGKGVLFTLWSGTPANSRIAVFSRETGKTTELIPGGSHPRYVPTGHIVYGVGGTLRAVGFDQDRLTLTGSPVPVVEGVTVKETSGAVSFAVAGDGSLVYLSGTNAGAQSTLVWVDREGKEAPLELAPREYFQAFVSPDGTRIAATIGNLTALTLWTTDIARPALTPITTGDVNPFGHLWTPDSRRIVFGSLGGGILWTLADGTGQAERLTTVKEGTFASVEGWAPDGKTLVFTNGGAGRGGARIGLLPVAGDGGAERTWKPLIDRNTDASMLSVSPDGRWIAYQSAAAGQYGVYVERFPGLGDRELISDERGGWGPLWSANGRELFYRRLGDGAMMAVPIQTAPALRVQPPRELFKSQGYVPLTTPQPGGGAARQWDRGPDGRFLMLKATSGPGATARLILVQHWFEELKRLVPAG